MRKAKIPKDYKNQRYLTIEDARIYYQLGTNTLRALSDKANATRRVGRKTLIDKFVLDGFLDDSGDKKIELRERSKDGKRQSGDHERAI